MLASTLLLFLVSISSFASSCVYELPDDFMTYIDNYRYIESFCSAARSGDMDALKNTFKYVIRYMDSPDRLDSTTCSLLQVCDFNGRTAIMNAVLSGQVEATEFLTRALHKTIPVDHDRAKTLPVEICRLDNEGECIWHYLIGSDNYKAANQIIEKLLRLSAEVLHVPELDRRPDELTTVARLLVSKFGKDGLIPTQGSMRYSEALYAALPSLCDFIRRSPKDMNLSLGYYYLDTRKIPTIEDIVISLIYMIPMLLGVLGRTLTETLQ